MKISRRALLAAAAPLSLSGCLTLSQLGQKVYTDVNVVAKKFEDAIKKAKTDLAGAAADLAPYVVPVCQIFVSLVSLAGQVGANNPALASNASFKDAVSKATVVANTPFVKETAASGVPATGDIVGSITSIIQIATLIINATQGKATPTVAAVSA